MDKHYFKKLLQKYGQGKLTSEERQLLISYYNLFQDEADITDMLSSEQKENLKKNIQGAIWSKIVKEEQTRGRVRFLEKKNLKLAAAAVFFLICSAGLLYFFNNRRDEGQKETPIVLHQKENRIIFLPDGSKVILNGESKLNYPSTFSGLKKREVILTGEAYFDIKHNSAQPFVVRTGSLETVVLGTAFNVKAYPEEKTVTVTVTRGKVKVIDDNNSKTIGIITPNQQITYNKEKANSIMKVIDAETVLDWKNQDLICDNVTIAEAAGLLKERFGVEIIIEDLSVRSQRFTATFSNKDGLDDVLNSICVFNGLTYDYRREDSLIILRRKN